METGDKTGLRKWLEDLGEVRDFDALLELYRAAHGPIRPLRLRRRLWVECDVAVDPVTDRLALPDDWPPADGPGRAFSRSFSRGFG